MKRAIRGLGAAPATPTKGPNGEGPDLKTLPASQQKGREAVIAAHGKCG